MRSNECLETTLTELRKAGFANPVVTRSGHWKVKCDGLPPITVACTPKGPMAVHMARRTVKKIIAQNKR